MATVFQEPLLWTLSSTIFLFTLVCVMILEFDIDPQNFVLVRCFFTEKTADADGQICVRAVPMKEKTKVLFSIGLRGSMMAFLVGVWASGSIYVRDVYPNMPDVHTLLSFYIARHTWIWGAYSILLFCYICTLIGKMVLVFSAQGVSSYMTTVDNQVLEPVNQYAGERANRDVPQKANLKWNQGHDIPGKHLVGLSVATGSTQSLLITAATLGYLVVYYLFCLIIQASTLYPYSGRPLMRDWTIINMTTFSIALFYFMNLTLGDRSVLSYVWTGHLYGTDTKGTFLKMMIPTPVTVAFIVLDIATILEFFNDYNRFWTAVLQVVIFPVIMCAWCGTMSAWFDYSLLCKVGFFCTYVWGLMPITGLDYASMIDGVPEGKFRFYYYLQDFGVNSTLNGQYTVDTTQGIRLAIAVFGISFVSIGYLMSGYLMLNLRALMSCVSCGQSTAVHQGEKPAGKGTTNKKDDDSKPLLA
jgi:hypothetical protein